MKTSKLLTLTFLINLLLFSCSNEKKFNPGPHISDFKLKGKVKAFKRTKYKPILKFGEIENGEKETIETYNFNEDGNLVEYNIKYCDKSWRNWDSKSTLIYDENGYLLEENSYNNIGDLKTKSKYTYDENETKIIVENVYESNGSLDKKILYEYDERGNKIMERWQKPNGTEINKFTFKYDEKNRPIEAIQYSNDTIYNRDCLSYSDDGKQMESQTYFKNVKSESKSVHTYNDLGEEIEWKNCNQDGSLCKDFSDEYTIHTMKYIYDTKSNWIKEIDFSNNEPQVIYEREIEYY